MKKTLSVYNFIEKFMMLFGVRSKKKTEPLDNDTETYLNLAYLPKNVGTYLGEHCYIYHPETKIGKYTSIAHNVIIGAGQHPYNWLAMSPFVTDWKKSSFEPYKACRIGNDVWIGMNAVIMDGIQIGDGAVIGSNAVVTKDVEPYSIVAGVPAKEIKKRFDSETINALLEIKWWDMPEDVIKKLPCTDVKQCIEILKAEKRKMK